MRRFRLKAELQPQPASQDCRSEDRPLDVFGESSTDFRSCRSLSPPRSRRRLAKPSARSTAGSFYFGIAGLVVVVALVACVRDGVWNLRDVGAGYLRAPRSEAVGVRSVMQAAFASQPGSPGSATPANGDEPGDATCPTWPDTCWPRRCRPSVVARIRDGYALTWCAQSRTGPTGSGCLLARRLAYGADAVMRSRPEARTSSPRDPTR